MINVKRMIEFCWQHEEDVRRAIAEKRLDNGGVVTGGGGHCRVSDPTAQKAIQNVSDVPCVEVEYGAYVNDMRNVMTIKRPLQWLKAAHRTKEHYADKKHHHRHEQRSDIFVSCVSEGVVFVGRCGG